MRISIRQALIYSPNVSHWASNTHHRHTAGFNYGVPWRAATRNNVFCRGEARRARPVMTCIIRIACNFSWHDVNKVLTENAPTAYLTGEACLAPTVALLARIRNATLFFALKVQYNLAQGSTLGYDTTRPMRPVGATH